MERAKRSRHALTQMTAAQYKAKRKKVGTWKTVAELLGLNLSTIARREAGTLPITKEAILSIKFLAATRNKKPHE